MHIVAKFYFTILLCIILLVAPVFGSNCYLNFNREWDDEYRLFLTQSSNNQIELLRDQSVASNSPLYMVCNREPKIITANCTQNGAFDINLPVYPKCQERESISPVRREEKASYCRYTLYRIGFDIPTGSSTQFYETYQVCFDKDHLRPVFTINQAYPKAGGRPSALYFNPDDIFYGNLFHAYDRRSTYARFKQLLGDQQNYMNANNIDHIIDRGHLSPSADFATTNLKKSTFNLINAIPQFKTVDNENWRLIEEWVRHSSRTPANICTGVLDCDLNSNSLEDLNCVLQLRHVNGQMVPMFLADYRKIPIPLWTYKIVRDNKNVRTVFLTYNNIYHEGYTLSPPSDICNEVQCPLQLDASIKYGRTFCCHYSTFLNRAVPHLNGIC